MPIDMTRPPSPDPVSSTDNLAIERTQNGGFIVRCSSMSGDEPEKAYAFTSLPELLSFAEQKLQGGGSGDQEPMPGDAGGPPMGGPGAGGPPMPPPGPPPHA